MQGIVQFVCLTCSVLLWGSTIFLVMVDAKFHTSYCDELSSKKRSSFLWQIKHKRDPSSVASYFFGTIHVTYTEVWDWLDPAIIDAFRGAGKIVFELDLNDPKTVQSLAQCQILPDKKTLETVLPDWLYTHLKNYMAHIRRILPSWIEGTQTYRDARADMLFKQVAGDWERKRPIWVMLALQALNPESVRQMGIPVLDLYLAQLAEAYEKSTGSIERVKEQCKPLNSLSDKQMIFALNRTLHKHQAMWDTPDMTDALGASREIIYNYNCGRLDETVFQKDFIQVSGDEVLKSEEAVHLNSYFHRKLIRKRNLRMARRVTKMLHRHPKLPHFFAFGAGHFLGDRSVIQLMKRRGFTVEPIRRSGLQHQGAYDTNYDNRATRQLLFPKSHSPGELWFRTGTSNLRTDTFRPLPVRPKPKPRKNRFNDLWIRITTGRDEKSSSRLFPKTSHPYQASQFMNSAAALSPISSLIATLWTIILYIRFQETL